MSQHLWFHQKFFWSILAVGLFTAVITLADNRDVPWFHHLELVRETYVIKNNIAVAGTLEGYQQILWFREGRVLSVGNSIPGNHRQIVDLQGEQSPFPVLSITPYCKLTIYAQSLSGKDNTDLLLVGDQLDATYMTLDTLFSPFKMNFTSIVRGITVQAELLCKTFNKKMSPQLLKEVVGTSGILLE